MPSNNPDVSDIAHAFLATPLTRQILATHPNSLPAIPGGLLLDIPANLPYIHLLHAYLAEIQHPDIPAHIQQFIASIRGIQLPRTPIHLPHASLPLSPSGMSPKKAHEVARMAAYIVTLARLNDLPEDRLLIVDVGAGQGYLTRTLKALLPRAHILALDADEEQRRGARKWEDRLLPASRPPIAHRTVLISEKTLRDVVDEWVQGDIEYPEEEADEEGKRPEPAPAPVLFVALHACGSLTPDVLRAFISSSKSTNARWISAGVVAVGCCYNLMNPSDFPLSQHLLSKPPLDLPSSAFHLAAQIPETWLLPDHSAPTPAVALAIRKVVWRALLEKALLTARPAESPSDADELRPRQQRQNKSATVPARWPRRPEMWASTSSSEPSPDQPSSQPPSSSLQPNPHFPQSEPQLQPQPHLPQPQVAQLENHLDPTSGIGATPAMRRLGRLRDTAYADWGGFLREAGTRMGATFNKEEAAENIFDNARAAEDGAQEATKNAQGEGEAEAERRALESQLEALHVLRCLVGPVVESTILRDRVRWVEEELGLTGDDAEGEGESAGPPRLRVALVNLFDQMTGSGRNVAIVVARRVPSYG